jgi:hypothetical protein
MEPWWTADALNRVAKNIDIEGLMKSRIRIHITGTIRIRIPIRILEVDRKN